ncbi:MAG: type II secretion system protein [bacterium]|nr:type II secretion system protein [bacterium]
MPEFHGRQVGFSLLEVGLAITLALIISAALATFYNQVKDDAGDTLCRNRISALQGMVETLAASDGGVLPSLDRVRSAWRARRPDDFDISPWGGRIFSPVGTNAIAGGDQPGCLPTDPNRATLILNTGCSRCLGYQQESNFGVGTLYYFRVVDTGGKANSAFQTSMWDQARREQVVVTGYGLASIKSANRYFMVTSGR